MTTTEAGGIVTTTRCEVVRDVYPNSAASAAGILPGDVVVRINGRPIRSAGDVLEVSHSLRSGDKVKFVFYRMKDGRPDADNPLGVPADLKNGPNREIELLITERPAVLPDPLTAPKGK